MIKFPCPNCGTNNEAPVEDAGVAVLCGNCESPMTVPALISRGVRKAQPVHRVDAPLREYDRPDVQKVQITNPATYYNSPGDWYEHPLSGYRLSANWNRMFALSFLVPPWFLYRYDEKASWFSHLILYPVLVALLAGILCFGFAAISVRPDALLFGLSCLAVHVLWSIGLVAHTHKRMLMQGWRLV